MLIRKPLAYAVFTSIIGAAHSVGAVAQQQGAGVLEEVIVTAERRESNLQDTPLAINAFSSEDIERSQILDTQDLANLTPSLVFNSALAGAQISIRGVGQGNPIAGSSPGVALHIDGVYLGRPFTNTANFYEAERFEILRGPQGTLYGRNSTGGSINIITRKPTFEPEFKMTAGYGDYDRAWLKLSGSNAVVEDTLAVRGSVVIDSRDGYIENKTTGEEVADQDLKSYAASALYTPTDNVDVLLKADYQNDDRYGRPFRYLEHVPGSGVNPENLGATLSDDPSEVYNDLDRDQEDTYWGVNGTVTIDFDTMTLKSITAYRDSELNQSKADNDGTDLAFISIGGDTAAEEFTQEFILSGIAMEDNLDWVAGINYYTDDLDSGSDTSAFFGSVNILNDYQEEVTAVGLFTQGTYAIKPDLRMTAGVRYTADEKEKTHSIINSFGGGCVDKKETKDWNKVTWKLGADYDVGDSSMLYGSVGTGYKAGGFNAGSCNDTYDEETLTAYEIGFKSQFLDQTLQLNGALFYYDYDDMQVRAFEELTLAITNAGQSEVKGVELDFVYLPFNQLQFDGGVALLDASYKDSFLPDPMNATAGEVSVDGNQMERAPDLKLNVGVEYTLGDVSFRYEVAYTDDMYVDAFENDFSKIEANTIQNFRAYWRPSSYASIDVQAYVLNLADEEVVDYLVPSSAIGGTAGSYAPPRTWGILVNWTPSL